jgi:hypothetical protein
MLLCALFSFGQGPNLIEVKPISTHRYDGDPVPQSAFEMGSMSLRLESPKPVIIGTQPTHPIFQESRCNPITEAGNAKYRCLIGEGFIAEFSGKAITNRAFDRIWQSEDCNITIYYKGDTAVAMSDEISGQISVFDSRYLDGCMVYADWFTGYKVGEGE